MRVLSIDDLGDTVAMARGALKAAGIAVIEASNWHEAVAELQNGLLDFILCDARFPDSTGAPDLLAGPRLLEGLRRGEFGPINQETRAIILTAFAPQVNAAAARVRDIDGVLAKRVATLDALSSIMGVALQHEHREEACVDRVRIDEVALCVKPYHKDDVIAEFRIYAIEKPDFLKVPVSELPDEVAFHYVYHPRPWAVWLTYDALLDGTPPDLISIRQDFGEAPGADEW